MMFEAEDINPKLARMVGRKFVKQYYKDSSGSPGFVHRYYKDKSVLFRADDDGFPSETTTIKDINRMILSFGYDKLKVIVKSMDARFFDFYDRVKILVTGSLIGKDGVTQSFYQMFVIEPQEQETGCYFVLYDQFYYMEDDDAVSDVEDDDAVSDVEDGYKGLVCGDDAVKSRDGNKALVSDEEDTDVEDTHSHDGNKADIGELQDGSVIDAEPSTAIKNEEEQVPESFGQTGGASSSFSLGSGSKEGLWAVVSSKKCNRKREDENGSRSRKTSRIENESTTNRTIIDLHGETVESATLKVIEELEKLSSLGSEQILILITGRGVHSVDGIPLIKNAITDLLEKKGIEWEEENRGGRLVVKLDGKRKFIFSSDADTDHHPRPPISEYFNNLR